MCRYGWFRLRRRLRLITLIRLYIVYGLDCSPFHRNVFASCGGDGQIRISSLLQATPLLTIGARDDYMLVAAELLIVALFARMQIRRPRTCST